MALKQKDRFLHIDTVLTNPDGADEDDNFALIQVRGAEGISFPYAFDLALIGPKARKHDPADLIGTRARFGIRHLTDATEREDADLVFRHGLIESFAETGMMGDFRSYAARLVPAFKMTAYETRFRVFEERTLEQILREVLRPYAEIELNTNQLREEAAEIIPYCVQFGESTFNFVHRLLDRFGAFYRFEHELNDQHEVLVVGGRGAVPPVQTALVNVASGDPAAGTVTGLRRSFVLATRTAHVGNFNELNPATPFRGRSDIAPAYDLMREHPMHEAISFPVPATVAPQPRDYADRRMHQNEGGVFSVTGQTRNTQFRAGRKFIVDKDTTVPEGSSDTGASNKTFLLKTCSIFAFDHSALVSTGQKLFDMIKGLLGLGSGDKNDVATAAAQSLLDQIKKDVESGTEIFNWLDKQPGAKNPSGLPEFVGNAIGLGGSAVAGAVPLLIATAKGVKDLIEKFLAIPEGVSIAFEALPFDPPHLRDVLPTPSATRPVAYGPHLAMVVGPDGINTAQRDIFTDALGRVRIRFPWDPGPDDPNDPLGQEAILTGRNTCFVRVSDGWAGERLGLQFIPRIGQEVVIGFIDGDPERPMVVGRAYNARGGTSHLPFLPATAQGKQLSVPADLKGTETDQATRSGIRTKTTPRKPEGQSGFHMMRLEDKQGEEQFLIRSERRMDQTAFGSRFDTTHGNLNILVGGGTKEPGKPPPGGAIATTAGGTWDLHVGKERYENIDANWNTTAKADVASDVTGEWVTYAGKDAKISANSLIVVAHEKISLRVGDSRIVITPASIYIQAAMVRENQGGPIERVGDSKLTEAADASIADPGEPPDFLARLPKGGGGGRRTHVAHAKTALVIVRGADKKIHVGRDGKGAVTIDDSDPDFADRVGNDLNKYADTPEGDARLQNINNNAAKPVVIQKPPPGATGPAFTTSNPKGATRAGEPTGRKEQDGTPELGSGRGTGGAVVYDPKDHPRPGDPNSPTSNKVLDGLLSTAENAQNGRLPGNSFTGQVPPTPPPPPPAPAGGVAPASPPPPPPPPRSGSE